MGLNLIQLEIKLKKFLKKRDKLNEFRKFNLLNISDLDFGYFNNEDINKFDMSTVQNKYFSENESRKHRSSRFRIFSIF